jgi:hypothetical protein
VLAALLLSLGTVTSAAAQSGSPPQDSVIGEAQMLAYAKSFSAIAAARDSAHAELALPRNKTDQLQRELREKLLKQVNQILQQQGLTSEQYARITYVISRDATQRKHFEEVLARLVPRPTAR